MASTTNRITVSTVATTIIVSNTSRRLLTLTNSGTVTAYVGGTSTIVATIGSNTTGAFPILGGELIDFNDYTGTIYAITESGTTTIGYDEEEVA